jgi:hypothetical protein
VRAAPRLARVKIRQVVAAAALPAMLAITGCAPVDGAQESSSPPSAAASATATPEATPLAADALMLLTATATASTGAQLGLRLIVHKPVAWDDAAAAEGITATTAWCADEIDTDVIAATAPSFTRIEVVAEQLGELDWPTQEPVWLHPSPSHTTLAAVGDVAQLPFPSPQPGDYVPHCRQTAVLSGAGSGSLFSGADQDALGRDGLPSLHFWSRLTYGFNNDGDPAAVPTIQFTDCTVEITDLGQEFGAPGAGWHEDFLPSSCIVGGMTGY